VVFVPAGRLIDGLSFSSALQQGFMAFRLVPGD
jgi:hypothetical protein